MNTEWPELVPLIGVEVAPPPFPTESLSRWLGQFVEAQSASAQVPEDMTGMLALSALSAAAQGRVSAVAEAGSWVEPVTLYVAVTAPPGERKSSVFEHVTRPIEDWEAEVQDLEAPMVAQSQIEHMQMEKLVESLAAKVAKDNAKLSELRVNEIVNSDTVRAAEADLAGVKDQLLNAKLALRQHVMLHPTRVIYNDLTPEAAVKSLSEQTHSAIAVMSDEGGVFEVLSGGRYNDKMNLDVWLKGHSGGKIQVDRVGRDPETVQRAILTLGLAIQPSVLADIGKSKQMYGRGLLARFAYSLPQTLIGNRVRSQGVPDAVRQAYHEGLKNIARAAHGLDEVRLVPLAEDADERLMAFQYEELEPRLGEDDGDLYEIGDWANKEAGLVLRIATLIAMARVQGVPSEVELEDIEAALAFAPYLEAHAKRAFGMMGITPSMELELKVVRRIIREQVGEFTLRELTHWNRQIRGLKKEDAEELLGGLEKMGYFKKVVVSMQPLRVKWVVNPAILEAEEGE